MQKKSTNGKNDTPTKNSMSGKNNMLKRNGAPKVGGKEGDRAVVVRSEQSRGVDLEKLLEQRRKSKRPDDEVEIAVPSPPVSLGPAGAIVDALINTSPEKLLELTDFDRNQVSLVPQVVVVDDMWDYTEQVLAHRTYWHEVDCRGGAEPLEHTIDAHRRKHPEIPDTSGRFVHVLAQCRRSLGGKMKKALEDMALAELETKSMEEGAGFGDHNFED